MTIIRAADPAEIPALASPDTGPYLTGLLASGCTRPEWCHVADAGDGRLTGSVVLWAVPGNDIPSDIVILEAPWDEPGLATGHALLEAARRAALALGATVQGHVLDGPAQAPQWQHQPERRRELLQRNGFKIARDGLRYRWTAGNPVPAQDERLTWRSLDTLGEAPFIDLLEELLADTADALLRAEVDNHGLRGAAEVLWRESLDFPHEDSWYEIGYDERGNAAAVSLPARNATTPIIGFVGVSPHQRGKGYAAAVVARGTSLLAGAGAQEIRGDCDAANVAMAKGFERAGYERFARREEFRRAL